MSKVPRRRIEKDANSQETKNYIIAVTRNQQMASIISKLQG